MKVKPEKYMKIIPPPHVVLVSTLHGDMKNREILSRLLISPVYHVGAKEGEYAGKGAVIS